MYAGRSKIIKKSMGTDKGVIVETDKESFGGYEMNAAASGNEKTLIMPFEHEQEFFIEDIGSVKKKYFYSFLKRTFDFLTGLIALIALLPVMLVISIIIKCSSKGPVFYVQERLGYNGRKIKIPKFRSMRVDAEKNGAQWSGGDSDDRIYPFGRFLRKTRLDELPQLWSCITGSLSLVGPRPERECFYAEFEKYVHGFSQRMKVKPGITGWAQVNGGYDLRPEEKILYDIEYIKKRSIWFDIKILFKTVAVVFGRKGAK